MHFVYSPVVIYLSDFMCVKIIIYVYCVLKYKYLLEVIYLRNNLNLEIMLEDNYFENITSDIFNGKSVFIYYEDEKGCEKELCGSCMGKSYMHMIDMLHLFIKIL